MRNGDDFSPAVIERIAGLLDEFRGDRGLTLSQLALRTGLPRSSVHRLLAQLVELDWVCRQGPVYTLSRSLIEWGAIAREQDDLHRAAHPVLHELHAATGLVAHLAVIDGSEVRYLDKIGQGSDRLPSRIGGRLPALRTALGQAIIAQTGLTPGLSPAPALGLGAPETGLRQQIAHIRQRGVAHEHNETVPGVGCVAAPIGTGRVCLGALSVTGPVERVNVVALAAPVRSAAHAIWRSLGAGTPDHGPRDMRDVRASAMLAGVG